MRPYASWSSAREAYLEAFEVSHMDRETVRSCRHKLDRALKFVNGTPKKFNRASLHALHRDLVANYAPVCVKDSMGRFRNLLEFLDHPLKMEAKMIRVRVPLREIRTYSEDEMSRIIGWAMHPHASRGDRRTAVYLAIASTAAVRAGEMVKLRWRHWLPRKGLFRLIESKTGVARWVAVSNHVVPVVEAWRAECESDWVFPSFSLPGNHIHTNTIRRALKLVSQKLDLDGIQTHRFRPTMCATVAEVGGTYEDMAAILGHASIETTRRYYRRITWDDGHRDVLDRAVHRMFEWRGNE